MAGNYPNVPIIELVRVDFLSRENEWDELGKETAKERIKKVEGEQEEKRKIGKRNWLK